MNILVFQNEQELNEVGAGIIASLLQTNPRAVLGLATGGTPVGIYRELIKMFKAGKVSFKQSVSFNLDEYVGLPEGHQESYRTYMNNQLFDHIDIPVEHTHIPNGNAEDLVEECSRFDRLINQYEQINLQILGIGHNGHIGFNEPAPTLESNTHVTNLSEETRQANARYFPSIQEVPECAITMGVSNILKANQILLVIKGADKAEIARRALTGLITTQFPATLLQTHPHLTVLMTQEVAI